jgi:hypothetical protein
MVVLRPVLRRLLGFSQFLFGGRYSLLWLALTLLARALVRGAEEVAAPPEVIDKAVDAATAPHEREAVDAAWELTKDIDVTSKGWYGRLRREWESARQASLSGDKNRHESPWSGELRTLGKLVSRRAGLLRHIVPRTVLRPFLIAIWATLLSCAVFLLGFFAVLLRLFCFLLPAGARGVAELLLGGMAMAALPLTAIGFLVVVISIGRGIGRLFDWLRRFGHQPQQAG